MANAWWISPWGYVPLLIALALTLVNGVVAATTEAPSTGAAPSGEVPVQTTPGLKLGKTFFEGPGLTNSGAVSTVLSLLPLLLSEEVRANPASAALLSAATLLFALSTFFGLWLYSTVTTHPVEDGGHTDGEVRILAGLQGAIVWWLIVGAGCFIVFVVMNPLAASPAAATAKPPVVIQCDGKGCALAP